MFVVCPFDLAQGILSGIEGWNLCFVILSYEEPRGDYEKILELFAKDFIRRENH